MHSANWQRILATTDFSPFSTRAVEYAHALAERVGAELHVLHVTPDISDAVAQHGVSGMFDPADAPDERTEWLGRLLGETGTIRHVEAVLVGKDVAGSITRYASDKNIDLIVMATHGRSGLVRLWLGSIVEKVLRSAPCPVLALRPTAADLTQSLNGSSPIAVEEKRKEECESTFLHV
jgi:nucleotide-binding universal stress UspA family protein